ELGSDVGDRASANDHLSDSSLPSKSGERGITVGHGTGLLPADGCLDTTHRAGQGPVPSSPLRDYNVMTRNTYAQHDPAQQSQCHPPDVQPHQPDDPVQQGVDAGPGRACASGSSLNGAGHLRLTP